MTDKLRAAAEMALEALEDTLALCINYKSVEDADGYVFTEASDVIKQGESAHNALRQALDQLPDTTKMIDTGIDRGAWSDVPDATKWVDELRGGEDLDEPPQPIGEVQIEELGRPYNAGKVILHFYGEPPPVGTKLYAAPPKREWVGLTDSELPEGSTYEFDRGVRWAEAKLKEKNDANNV